MDSSERFHHQKVLSQNSLEWILPKGLIAKTFSDSLKSHSKWSLPKGFIAEKFSLKTRSLKTGLKWVPWKRIIAENLEIYTFIALVEICKQNGRRTATPPNTLPWQGGVARKTLLVSMWKNFKSCMKNRSWRFQLSNCLFEGKCQPCQPCNTLIFFK